MNNKPTAGPWKLTNDGWIVAGDRRVASVQNGGIINLPDAFLIAAAPDLLEACKTIQALLAAALAKAEGG